MTSEWWRTFYDNLFLQVMMQHKAVEPLATMIDQLLSTSGATRVFDQCCGSGRISRALADRGYQVTGVDQCAAYISEASRLSGERDNLNFEVGDARTYSIRPTVDAVLNLWTSFGYGKTPTEDEQMLSRAFDSLGKGGMLILDVFNSVQRIDEAPTVTSVATKDYGEVEVERCSTYEDSSNLLHQQWVYRPASGAEPRKHQTSVRCYRPKDLERLCDRVGFEVQKILGNYEGQGYVEESPRCIIVATKQ